MVGSGWSTCCSSTNCVFRGAFVSANEIGILIRDACHRAIEEGRPCLEQPILEAAWKDIQTKQVIDFLDLIRQRGKR